MSNEFIAPPLPILSFGTVGESELPFPNYSIPISNELKEDPTIINLKHVAQAVLKAKRVAVVCGAGISCASGIPDFRSTEGLFESLKKKYPEAKLTSGKDLFDASLFSSEANAAIFYTMIAELKTMSDNTEPTSFHKFLKSLDDEGKLHRVYTQNIDGLEERAGLSYGLGSKISAPTPPRRRAVSASPVKSRSSTLRRGSPDSQSTQSQTISTPSTPPPSRSQPSTTNIIPKCIPLHGHLSTLSCPHCSHSESIVPHLPLLASGNTLSCPACTSLEEIRSAIGGRSRGVGMMKPDVVLYGEAHREGERVGEITRKDLMGVRPDLLLVVGTSLKVPGTKLLVRELAKVIRPAWTWTKSNTSSSNGSEEDEDDEEDLPIASGSTSMSIDSNATIKGKGRSTSRKPSKPEKVSVIYLNYEFPKPAAEWKDVFDVWMRGDVQEFVELVENERKEEELKKEKKLLEKEMIIQRREEKEKKRLEKEANIAAGIITPSTSQTSPRKSPIKPKPLKEPKLPKSTTTTIKSKTTVTKPPAKIKSTAGAGSIRKVPVKRESKVITAKKVEGKSTTRDFGFYLDFTASKPSSTIRSKAK